MTTPTTWRDDLAFFAPAPAPHALPLLFEAEEENLGESTPHFKSIGLLAFTLATHLASRPQFQVCGDLNCYYGAGHPRPSFTPDVMVISPSRDLGEDLMSYTLGADGPAPVLVIEVLSEATALDRDLGSKIPLYAGLQVAEYILLDRSGTWLPQRLLLKRLQPDGTYRDEQDPDGGVSSDLGFQLKLADDNWPDLYNRATGHRYARPTEAEQEAVARRLAEAKQRDAEAKQHQAEEKQREEAEARRLAEEKQKQAEEKQKQEAEARRLAEEHARALQAELDRLRQQHPPEETP